MSYSAQQYTVRIDVRISDRNMGGPGLSISEEQSVDAASFLELAGILGEFHKVFEKLNKEKDRDPRQPG